MKKLSLTFIFLIGFVSFAEAQYGYGQPGNQRRSSLPRGPVQEKEEVKPKTAEEIVDMQMPRILEVIDLNPFEEAVVRSIMNKYVQQSIELRLLQLDADQTREGMEKIRRNQEAELKAGLPPAKFEAFQELREEGFYKMKKKKKKRKKGKKPKD